MGPAERKWHRSNRTDLLISDMKKGIWNNVTNHLNIICWQHFGRFLFPLPKFENTRSNVFVPLTPMPQATWARRYGIAALLWSKWKKLGKTNLHLMHKSCLRVIWDIQRQMDAGTKWHGCRILTNIGADCLVSIKKIYLW